MNVLITGGSGFIGANLIRYWLNKYPSDTIINFDKLTYAANPLNLKDVETNTNYKFVKGDICNKEDVSSVMTGIDIVIHLAAESHVDRSIEGPLTFTKTNVEGTHVLLEAALKNNVKRFHHVSTDEVYGDLPLNTTEKFNENSPYKPRSPYSASKAASDLLARSYFYTYNLPITISNCENNYGPYCHPEKFIPRSITSLLEGKKIKIYGDGNYIRPWLYVEDHCRAIDAIVTSAKVGELFTIGGNTQFTNNLQVAKKLIDILGMGGGMIEFVNDRPGHDLRYALDSTKIMQELGWSEETDFDTGLRKTVEWYKNNPDNWRSAKIETEGFYAKIKR